MAITKKKNGGEDAWKKECLCTVIENANWCSHHENKYGVLKISKLGQDRPMINSSCKIHVMYP
jgi:hypothetical protein